MGESSKFERPTTHKEEDDDEEKYGLTAEEKYAYALERSEDSVRYISKDPLTGAASLSEFTTQLEQSLKMVRRWVPASLVYIDIDHFKRVNDTFGHSGGDVVLKKVCAFLMRSVRESDVVARIGGEEPFSCQDRTDSVRQKRRNFEQELRSWLLTNIQDLGLLQVLASFR